MEGEHIIDMGGKWREIMMGESFLSISTESWDERSQFYNRSDRAKPDKAHKQCLLLSICVHCSCIHRNRHHIPTT
ncbi:hypothetical protein L2E82_34828 [Cichorium intybus]|uniref:Uncharacterized protein n=1 Tax=Cichorium intybus TaxID=13427 RepID=A0ACB9BMS3_CICIN|nr:hypothetical protein L2E82_34828 [Cichorium intybus]